MSDETPQDSKTFDPTPQRKKQFRDEGKVAQSKDVTSAVMFVASLLAFGFVGGDLFKGFAHSIRLSIEQVGTEGGRGGSIWDILAQQGSTIGPAALTFGFLVIGSVMLISAFQTGFLWAPKNIAFKPDRIAPLKKLGQIFNPKQAGMQILLSSLKIGAAGWVMWLILRDQFVTMSALSLGTRDYVYEFLGDLLFFMLGITTIVFAVLAILDYAWQKHQLTKQMKMSREEVKRDMEEQEGKPEIKGKRKQLHRELSMNRVIQAVPEADVVITNPTHLALVIRYRPGEDAAPIVTAKGADSLAAYIRSLAREHGVPLVENKPLARVLWRKVRVGKRIPNSLFQAVAEILAGVFKARNEAQSRGRSTAKTQR